MSRYEPVEWLLKTAVVTEYSAQNLALLKGIRSARSNPNIKKSNAATTIPEMVNTLGILAGFLDLLRARGG